jgi:hypothetical protein
VKHRWSLSRRGQPLSRGSGDRPPLSDEAAQLHWQIANGRAASRSRRYFVFNRLRYMWLLTFADSRYDRRAVMTEVSEFARRLRTLRDGVASPHWYSPELLP